MSNLYHTKNGHTSKRGAFINGIWHCDCEPRLPAEKFQTKNGGKNHGRWFYTCQNPQPKRCSFFLWSDDAKVREASAVISNSRTEPNVPQEPVTPRKSAAAAQPSTPFSRARSETLSNESVTRKLWHGVEEDQDDEIFSWSSSGDGDLASVAEAAARDQGSPRKKARTPLLNSPGKRTYSDTLESGWSREAGSPTKDTFHTPLMTKSTGLLSPMNTEIKLPLSDNILQTASSITSEVLQLLKPITLPAQVKHELVDLLKRHELRTQGIIRGRDITRVAVQSKEKKIAELQARITALEGEKETSRAVIAHLKQDFATSPKRQSRSRFGSRSEI